jgi:tight adherence protein B
MLLVILVFLLGAGAVFGAYAAIAYLPAMLERRRLDRRLADVTDRFVSREDEIDLVSRPREGALPPVEKLLARTSAGGSLAGLIEQSGVRTTPVVVALAMLVLGLGGAVLASQFGYPLVLAIMVGMPCAGMPLFYLMNRRWSRLRRFEEQFPEALDLLSRALRAGHAFQGTLSMVGEELPAPVGPEFRKIFDQQNYGLPLREALLGFVDRVPILDVRFFVTAVMIQRESGGNLAEILDNLGRVVRDRFKIRRQIRTHTAHGRFTAFVLLALPAVLGIVLTFLSPEHMRPLWEEGTGRSLLFGAGIMQTIGFFWIRQIIRIEV